MSHTNSEVEVEVEEEVVQTPPKKEKKVRTPKAPKKDKSDDEAEEEEVVQTPPKKEKKVLTPKAPKKDKSDDEAEEEEVVQTPPKKEKKVLTPKAPEKKTRKVHKEKASDFEEGYTKTEDGIDYIVKNNKWLVVKPPKVKRAPTAYSIFLSMKMKELRLENPTEKSTYYMKQAGEVWKTLTAEEKAAYKPE